LLLSVVVHQWWIPQKSECPNTSSIPPPKNYEFLDPSSVYYRGKYPTPESCSHKQLLRRLKEHTGVPGDTSREKKSGIIIDCSYTPTVLPLIAYLHLWAICVSKVRDRADARG
jgi:hypothetical protein